ncbi:MAG TPA: hypothetical protein PLD23_10405 [Armatimonadota bacterium]|nr:hypothetical protein [Armatimonadota bacterium]
MAATDGTERTRRMERAIVLRYADPDTAKSGPIPWPEIAASVGVAERTLRRWRRTPEWGRLMAEHSAQAEGDLLGLARTRLAQMVQSPNENLAFRAIELVLRQAHALRVEVAHRGAVGVGVIDVTSMTPEQIRALGGVLADADGAPRKRALPPPPPPPESSSVVWVEEADHA